MFTRELENLSHLSQVFLLKRKFIHVYSYNILSKMSNLRQIFLYKIYSYKKVLGKSHYKIKNLKGSGIPFFESILCYGFYIVFFLFLVIVDSSLLPKQWC